MTGPLPVAVSVKPRRRRPDSDVMLAQSMPLKGPLIDRYGRVHDDLRISVTDRCNLRCVYCMPEEGLSFLSKNELLTFDEITRLAQVAKSRWYARDSHRSSDGSRRSDSKIWP